MRSQMISREHQRRAPPQKSKKAKHPEDYSPPITRTRTLVGSFTPPSHAETESVCAERERQGLEQRKRSADNKKQTNEGRGGVQPFRRPEENRHLISLRTHARTRAGTDGSCDLHNDRLTPHSLSSQMASHFWRFTEKVKS